MLVHAPAPPRRLPLHAGSERRQSLCTPVAVKSCRHSLPDLTRRRRRQAHAAAAAAADSQPAAAASSPSSFPALHHPDVAHFLNLTNGLEAAPLLRSLGLPYTLCRLPSTLCEQQRFDALVAGADSALLAAAALGRTCLVWDFASRGLAHRGGPPRAVWYGLEFLAYAAHRKWFPVVSKSAAAAAASSSLEEAESDGGASPAPAPAPPSSPPSSSNSTAAAGEDWPLASPPRRAFLRGHDVTHVFEAALRGGRGWASAGAESAAAVAAGKGGGAAYAVPGFDPAVSGVSKASVKRLRYFRRFIPPAADGATHIRLWGAHRPTTRDSDVEWHVALARAECGPGGGGGGGAAGAAVVPPGAAAAAPAVGADGRVCPLAIAAELEALGFGLWSGGVPHAPHGVPAAAEAARAKVV